MKKLRLTALLTAMLAFVIPALSQVVTTEPSPLYDNSEDITIFFHADQGSKGLANLPESTKVYAHTGLITSKSKDDTDWKYATDWNKPADTHLMTYVEKNLYSLKIGNLKEFYGVKSASEVIEKLVFVFRDASGNKTGKNANGSDITVDVISTALQLDFNTGLKGTTITSKNPTVNFKLTTNQTADRIWLSMNLETVAEVTDNNTLEFTYTFTQTGQYNINAYAEKDGVKVSKNLMLQMVNGSEPADYPGGIPKMGTVRQSDGSVIFCLAAPEKEEVLLLGSWMGFDKANPVKMTYQDYDGQRYFWTSVSGLDADTPYTYYFKVDNRYNVGDPYARLILDKSNDKYIPASVYPDMIPYPSEVTDNVPSLSVYQENLNDYAWTDADFKAPKQTDLVIYEMLFRDFTGTEGKAQGNGTVRKAMEKLPYLHRLGVNAIELLPINEFNGNISWGYNPNFYFAPDKAYGTPDDYKEFIDKCHEYGMAVILDLVFNQTDWQHPWYVMYPVGQNPMYNADAPHAYSVLNDINQGHPLIRQQWKDVVKFWMEEYHVDGYRFDLVKGLGDNSSYANNGDAATNAYNATRVANMRAIQEAMNEINPEAYFINENLAGAKEENEMAQTGMLNWANVNYAGGQYAKGFKSGSGLNRMYAPKDSRTQGSTVAYLESHDEERLAYMQEKSGASLVKSDHGVACRRLGSAAAQMIMCPGAHMIWMFSEMGNAQTTKNADGGNNVDPKIVNWNLLDNPDNKGLMQNYSQLINIRLANPEMFDVEGDATFTINSADSNWDNGRSLISSLGDKQIITVTNPTLDKEVEVKVAFTSTNQDDYVMLAKSYGTNPSFSVAEGKVTLPANSFAVIASKSVSSDVKEIMSADEAPLTVWGDRGAVVVENAPAGFEVYDLSGVRHAVSDAVSGRVELPAGLYIVRGGQDACKVVVR